jgi:competence protein ComEA
MVQPRFRRAPDAAVTAAAQRRLATLRCELEQAGLPPLPTAPYDARGAERPDESETGAVTPVQVADPGRHARRRAPGLRSRLAGWLVDRLPPTLQGRTRLGAAQTGLVAVLAALGLALAAVMVLRSGSGQAAVLRTSGAVSASARPASAEPLVPVASVPVPSGAAGTGRAPTGVVPPPSRSGTVMVDVAGKVRRPGVVTLPAGSRVLDALRRAGGARRGVDLSGINLARVLVDGEQILVGVTPAPGLAASVAATSSAAGGSGQLVNLNTATMEGLEALPGVGPVTAQKILDWRTAHGSFTSVDELLEIDGIGEKTLADLAPYATL